LASLSCFTVLSSSHLRTRSDKKIIIQVSAGYIQGKKSSKFYAAYGGGAFTGDFGLEQEEAVVGFPFAAAEAGAGAGGGGGLRGRMAAWCRRGCGAVAREHMDTTAAIAGGGKARAEDLV
jgi:hypothetical protein